MLEPYALKGACTVLRGREVSNDLLLPDIGVEPPGEITPRESGLTSLGCLRTRPSDQLAREAEQMTAALLLVRPPADSARQPRTSIVQVGRLPHRVPRGALERLERHKPKGFRAVLRGLGSSNAPRLPGADGKGLEAG